MTEFKRPGVMLITGRNQQTGKDELFEFDPYDSTIHLLKNNKRIKIVTPPKIRNDKEIRQGVEKVLKSDKNSKLFDKDNPIKKNPSEAEFILIRLGSKCNYKCTYCAQTLCTDDDDSKIEKSTASEVYADEFIAKFPQWYKGGRDGKGSGTSFMFYGGEPFVYWKNLRKIAIFIKTKYPNVRFNITTNGSILDREKVDFLKQYFDVVAMSHDGPGQIYRDKFDHLDNPEHFALVKELADHFGIAFRLSAVLSKNVKFSRIAYNEYFQEKFGKTFDVAGGHISNYFGTFLEETNFTTTKEAQEYAFNSYKEIKTSSVFNFDSVRGGVNKTTIAFASNRSIQQLATTRCGFDSEKRVAVDIEGNFITCGNVSAEDISDNGSPHLIGTVNDTDSVYLHSGKHPLTDEKCVQCPVLLSCSGGCFFFDGEVRERNCLNMYYGYMGIFAYVFETITGHLPIYIDHPSLPDYQKDIFGMFSEESLVIKHKVFKLQEIS